MSHFTTLIIGDDPETQLEPFYEQGDEGDYFMEKEYEVRIADFEKAAKEVLKKARKSALEEAQEVADGKKPRNPLAGAPSNYWRQAFEKYQKQLAEGKFEEMLRDWYGGTVDEEGLYYVTNPNAKWDWYQLGGRWSGYFILKPGKKGVLGEKSWTNEKEETPLRRADQARKGDIDFEAMKAARLKDAEETWAEYEKKKKEPDFDATQAYFGFGIRKEDTKESYLARRGTFSTHAVLKDGDWFEVGKMGWWAVVTDEKDASEWEAEFAKLLDGLPDDTLLSVYDLHI